jgi:hypothetical protein
MDVQTDSDMASPTPVVSPRIGTDARRPALAALILTAALQAASGRADALEALADNGRHGITRTGPG